MIKLPLYDRVVSFFQQHKIAFFCTTAPSEANCDAVRNEMEEDRALIESASPARQREFVEGRYCARQVMKALGAEGQVLRGVKGEPVWPEELRGSISHTKGYYCAAAGLATDILGLGIDAERVSRVISDGALAIVATPAELEALPHAEEVDSFFRMVLFSAKESFYKMLFPLVQRYFYFDAVSVSVQGDRSEGEFIVRLEQDLGEAYLTGKKYQGYYFADGQVLLTTCFM